MMWKIAEASDSQGSFASIRVNHRLRIPKSIQLRWNMGLHRALNLLDNPRVNYSQNLRRSQHTLSVR
jgi:hypothetical protein